MNYAAFVHKLYWSDDLNCATTILLALSKKYSVEINKQVIDSLKGLPGASKQGELCGLVAGGLMFIGIYGSANGWSDKEVSKICSSYSADFKERFNSLSCSDLRPEGFSKENPPHLCEDLTVRALSFASNFLDEHLKS